MTCDSQGLLNSNGLSTTITEPCNPATNDEISCNASINDDYTSTNATSGLQEGSKRNNFVFIFAAASIAILVCLGVGFATFKLYKAKFSRRRNFNYTLSEDNGNIVGDETRVVC